MNGVSGLTIKARAKLNLVLDVTGRVGEKHALDTVMVPVSLYDDVHIEPSDDVVITYDGQKGRYENDTVKRTVEALRGRYFEGGARIEITKRIPERAGVGGSSADATAVVRGLEQIYSFRADDGLLERLGSDIPAMRFGAPCRMRGLGANIEPVRIPEEMYFVLVKGRGGIDTAECFARYDVIGGRADADGVVERLAAGEYFSPENALTASACSILPETEEILRAVRQAGFLAEMTGSGSGIFGYEYSKEEFDKKLARLMPTKRKEWEIIPLKGEEDD